MCELNAGYTTITGPRRMVERVEHGWRHDAFELSYALGVTVSDFQLFHLGPLCKDEECPAVGVVYHSKGLGRLLADQLQSQLFTRFSAPQVLCEPGFEVRATASGAPSASVVLNANRIQKQFGIRQAPSNARVAVLDSGDSAIKSIDMVDFVGIGSQRSAPVRVPSADPYGHGSAISEVIRTIRPGVSIETVRVLNDRGRADSFELFLALTYCLWGGRFDLVNASLTNAGVGTCANGLGGTLTLIQDLCLASRQLRRPTVVAAAGNAPAAASVGYPALLPGAVVVTATDWNGNDPGYNVSTANLTNPVTAEIGGTPTDSFGHFVDGSGASHEMYGTSFAAAVVTAAKLP